jgi:acetyltransferase
MKNLNKFFSPKSIAVIGASKDTKKIGHQLLKNIIDGGFSNNIYPINLDENRILGLKAFKSVLNVPEKIDMAIVAIPAEIVPQVLKECGKKKIGNVIIISAGFSEIGETGKKLEDDLKKIAEKYQINILGPNCLGLINVQKNLNLTFARTCPISGNLAIISQSGALGAGILDWLKLKKIGVSYFVSLGNKLNVDEIDILDYLFQDKKTKQILVYIEDTKNGEKLMQAIKKISSEKPIVFLKGGLTQKGQKAALSHTGALAGSAKIFKAAIEQSGAIFAQSLENAFDIIYFLNNSLGSFGKNIAIITNAGGPGIIATDEIEKAGLCLAKISVKSQKNLKKFLPKETNIKNPIDILGDANARRYRDVIKIIVNNKMVDAILVLLTPQTATEINLTAKIICQIAKKSEKPILTSFIGGESLTKAKNIFTKNSIPLFEFPEQAIAVIKKVSQVERVEKIEILKIPDKIRKNIETIIEKQPANLSYQIAKSFDLPICRMEIVRSREELLYVAKSLGYPLVLKTLNHNIIHKSFAGGVITNIKNDDELFVAYDKISQKFGDLASLSPQIDEGFELYLGAKRDLLFGPTILFGIGGVFVEGFNDITLRVFPIDKNEALKMVEEIHSHKIIEGYNKYTGLCQEKIAELILKVGSLISNFPEISEIDFNPVKATKDDLKILDARIVLKDQ